MDNFSATILGLVRKCPTLSDRVGGVMNLLLLTQEEAALAGRPVNQPRMDTENTDWETAKSEKQARRQTLTMDGGGGVRPHLFHQATVEKMQF